MKQNQPPQPMLQPIGYEGKARNVFGTLSMWTQNMPWVKFIMFILGWFTVPIEVFFRKDFGRRWLTALNFYAGLLVLVLFNMLHTVASTFSYVTISNTGNGQQQVADGPSLWDRFMDNSLWFILLAYLLMSSYHFFRIWWRERTNTSLHSFEDGTSRFEQAGRYLMWGVNIIAAPVIRFYIFFLPKEEQQRKTAIPPLAVDITAFTNTVVEPLILVILFFIFRGITATWLLVSAAALAVYASWKEEAKLDRLLDVRDSMIEMENMKEAQRKPIQQQATKTQNLIMQQVAEKVERNPEISEKVKANYPDIMDIIAEMNRER